MSTIADLLEAPDPFGRGRAAVAGAGIVGRLAALALSDRGWHVTLFDPGPKDGSKSCSYAAAGMLAPYAELEKSEWQIAQWGLTSCQLWPAILKRLPQSVWYQFSGSIVVAHRQDWGDFCRFLERVHRFGSQAIESTTLDSLQLANLEPELQGRFSKGLFFPSEGQLDPRSFLAASTALLSQQPTLDWQQLAVQTITPQRMVTAHQNWEGDLALDTRGLGARPQQPALRGVRGELLKLHAPEVHLKRPVRLIHPRYPLYIVPRPEQRYLIGATSIESDDQGPVTVQSALELLSAAYSLHTGFAEARIEEWITHCRPAMPDNLPLIDCKPGLLTINGLYRHGVLIGPAVVLAAFRQLQSISNRTESESPYVAHSS